MDPTLDYAKIDRVGGVQPWVVPLTEPLRKQGWKIPLDRWEPLRADQIPEDMRSPALKTSTQDVRANPNLSAPRANEPRANEPHANEPRASATGR